MNFPLPAANQPLTVSVASVDARCTVGPPSAESTFAGGDDLTLSFDLPASSDGLPDTIPAPIHGPLVELGTAATSYKTESEWGCWQHQRKPPGGLHAKGQGLRRSDDTYAWDCNLAPGWGAAQGRGRALPFMSVGFGKVVRWGGEQGIETGTNAWHSILVDHVSGWFSGYLHGNIVYVRDGDLVTPASLLGTIGKAHAVGHHLHFAVYSGENVIGRYDVDPDRTQLSGLRSIDIGFDTECFVPGDWTEVQPCRSVGSLSGKSSFVARQFELELVDSSGAAFQAESVSLYISDRTHPSLKLHALGTRLDFGFPLLPGVRINDSANDFTGEWIKNLQYWTASNNRSLANPDQKSISITQDGVIQALAAGEADVQVYFSGGVQTQRVIVHEQEELAP